MVERQVFPNHWNEQAGADCDKAKEKYNDYRMLFVHKIMSQPGTTVCDPAICEEEVKSAKYGRDVDDEESVEETYGCISASSVYEGHSGPVSLPKGRKAPKEGKEGKCRNGNGKDGYASHECHDAHTTVQRSIAGYTQLTTRLPVLFSARFEWFPETVVSYRQIVSSCLSEVQ
jgi:hypothetical protein